LLRDAWTVAIETLSWIEMRRLNERSALMKTVKQLGVKENRKKDYEYKNEVIETEKAIEANPDIQKPELKFAFTDKVKEIEEEIKLLKEV